jgi:hypothetical protein
MPLGDDRPFVQAGFPTISPGILPPTETHLVWLTMNAGAVSRVAKDVSPAISRTIHTADDVPSGLDERGMATMLWFAAALVRRLAGR